LIKDLRLEGICGMDDGNAFLPRFMERYNRKFAIPLPDLMICIGR